MSKVDRIVRESPFLKALIVVFSYGVAAVVTVATMAAFSLVLIGGPLTALYLGGRRVGRWMRGRHG